MADFSQVEGSQPAIPSNNPANISFDLGLTHPDSLLGGTMRGTQNIGSNGVQIDSANNRISLGSPIISGVNSASAVLGRLSTDATDKSFGLKITDTNGNTIVLGVQADGSMGMQITDSSGFLLFKLTGVDWDWFDKNFQTNTLRVGLLPDGNYGWVAVPPSRNISDAFNA